MSCWDDAVVSAAAGANLFASSRDARSPRLGLLAAAFRSAQSASLATASASAFLLFATVLSFVADTTVDQTLAWQLRGNLPSSAPMPATRQLAQRTAP